jgi:hypothetical protein
MGLRRFAECRVFRVSDWFFSSDCRPPYPTSKRQGPFDFAQGRLWGTCIGSCPRLGPHVDWESTNPRSTCLNSQTSAD